jgi:hypothetical protein
MRLTLLFRLVLLSAAPPRASAQPPPDPLREAEKERESGRIVPFLEDTEVHSPFAANLVFEAAIRPHLVFFQNYGDSLVASGAVSADEQSRGWARRAFTNVAIVGTPGVVLRMLRDVSKPVRTPSYLPRVQVQKLYVRLRNKRAALESAGRAPLSGAAADELSRPLSLFEGHVSINHFSNGQQGCAVVGQVRVGADAECVPEGIDGPLNLVDGSFSTNFLRFGSNYRRIWMRATPEDEKVAAQGTSELTVRLDVDRHLLKGRLSTPTIGEEYGKYRVRGMTSFATARLCAKRSMATLEGIFNPDPPGDMSSWTYAVGVSCYPLKRGDWGVFVRYYNGQDYYNIHYRETLRRVQVGVVHSQDGFFKLFRSR